MEDLYINDPTTDETFHLRVDSGTAKRAVSDPVFATEIVQRYVRANNKNSIYNHHCDMLVDMLEAGNDGPNTEESMVENSAASDMLLSPNDQICEDAPNNITNFWTRNETLALISAYDHFKENLNNYKKKKFIWSNIETYLSERGIMKTENAIECKWKNLLRTYKNIKDNNNSSGRGAIRFQFMHEMEEVMGERPLIQNSHSVVVGITPLSAQSGTIKAGNRQHEIEQSTSTCETGQVGSLDIPDMKTPLKKKEVTTIFSLKRKYLREKIDSMDEKKNQLREYLRMKKAREEREEKKLQLKERELEIEERKLRAMELFLQHQMQKK